MSRRRKALLIIVAVVVVMCALWLVTGLRGKGTSDKLAVLEIEGVISESKDTIEEIVKFKEDASIRAVIIRINSPGGAVGPTQEIYREVVKLKEKKKVYVSMGSVCASGGYYIASIGEKVYANPSTITGSIGVIMQTMMVEELLKKIGLKSTTIKAGEFKDTGSPFREMKPEERAYLDSLVENIHAQFIKDVAAGRKMQIDTARKLADGKIYTGTQALQLGLVDQIGDFYDTVDALKTTLNIKGKPVLVYTEKPFSFSRWLFSSLAREMNSRLFSSPFSYLFVP